MIAGYCRYVNDGTIYQRGQHFVEQSVNDSIQKINQFANESQKIN